MIRRKKKPKNKDIESSGLIRSNKRMEVGGKGRGMSESRALSCEHEHGGRDKRIFVRETAVLILDERWLAVMSVRIFH